uniref:alpha-ketoglutarate-dependent dioxygenase alkB homolog 7, mitochondrial-like isoform X1 n=1 Tax=Myxine glutinosa TaxID=7769 RepID=UPI00359018F9
MTWTVCSQLGRVSWLAKAKVSRPTAPGPFERRRFAAPSAPRPPDGFGVCEEFVSLREEQILLDEVEPSFRKMKYQFDHWDDAIHGYHEIEREKWSAEAASLLHRVCETAFGTRSEVSPLIHILDLDAHGYIKPHVDSIKFCGNTIAGLSLLSTCVMRFVHEGTAEQMDMLLKRRSFYIMRDKVRYKFTHEILKNEESYYEGKHIPRSRRIAIICRNFPEEKT